MALPYRRKRYSKKRSVVRKNGQTFKKPARTSNKRKYNRLLRRTAIRQAVASNETRCSMFGISDGQAIAHNNFLTLESSLFSLAPDILTNEGGSSYWKKGVIGNSYYCRGVSFRFMLENFNDRPHVIYRFMVVRAAHGNTPNRADLFEGLSGNKMLDYIDKDKYTVVYQKWISVKAHNGGTNAAPSGTTGISSGAEDRFTNPKKIVKIYMPVNKVIKLQDYSDRETIDGVANRQRQKDFNFHVLLYAYDNYFTLQDINNVGYVNDYVSKMYNKEL